MTERQVKALVKKWQEKLRLPEWVISTVVIPAKSIDESGTLADCHAYVERLQARLYIGASRDEATIEATVIHELLHVLMAELVSAGKAAAKQLPAQANALAKNQIETAEERAVRRLETVLCGEAANLYFTKGA